MDSMREDLAEQETSRGRAQAARSAARLVVTAPSGVYKADDVTSTFVANAVIDGYTRGAQESSATPDQIDTAYRRGVSDGKAHAREQLMVETEAMVKAEIAKLPKPQLAGKDLAAAIVDPLTSNRNISDRVAENVGVRIETRITRILKNIGVEVV